MKRMCRQCGERPAIFMRRTARGRVFVNADNDHDLCMQCTRSATSALHARKLPVKRTEVLVENVPKVPVDIGTEKSRLDA